MKLAASDLFAKLGVVEPSFWFILGGRGGAMWPWLVCGGVFVAVMGGVVGVLSICVVSVIVAVIISIFITVVVTIIISRASAAGVSSCAPGWEWSPCFWAFWQWCARIEKAGDQLIPIFFVGGFVNPAM
jgi:hypothetical protein